MPCHEAEAEAEAEAKAEAKAEAVGQNECNNSNLSIATRQL